MPHFPLCIPETEQSQNILWPVFLYFFSGLGEGLIGGHHAFIKRNHVFHMELDTKGRQ